MVVVQVFEGEERRELRRWSRDEEQLLGSVKGFDRSELLIEGFSLSQIVYRNS